MKKFYKLTAAIIIAGACSAVHAEKTRVVWLGSNYPAPGEYNQDNDLPSVNYVLNSDVPFEIALVRYGKPSGTAAVARSSTIPAPKLVDKNWVERPGNARKIVLWEDFDSDKIMTDFYQTMQSPVLVK